MADRANRGQSSDGDRAKARKARRERRRDLSREEILDGARSVLFRDGLAAMTVESVAREVGMSKTGLYYYFPSKDALVFELILGAIEGQARTIQTAVAKADDGGAALRAIIEGTYGTYAGRLDDFRLAFLFAQVSGTGGLHWNAEQFERLRPLNDLCFSEAAGILGEERKTRQRKGGVEPRLLAFLAHLATLGLLTMKGLVDEMDDPLVYSDEELVDGLARVFEAAAES